MMPKHCKIGCMPTLDELQKLRDGPFHLLCDDLLRRLEARYHRLRTHGINSKGVSIKGQSKVSYEESAVAAQADAQSALSQEKVPRAYQGAVRDYFDDLKK